jgi:Predicted ATPase (AAA+ superfamily)
MDYINRALEAKFLHMNNFFKAILITGARQVGKTTMLKHLAEGRNRTYVSLDDIEARELAQKDPEFFFQRFKPPIIIDEVQYAPELFAQIKILCDNSEARGQFWLTGSQQYLMMKNVSESLAGRIGITELFSFSRSELCRYRFDEPLTFTLESLLKRQGSSAPAEVTDIFQAVWQGGMPQTIKATPEERGQYFESYINSYLLRDVIQLGRVTDTIRFRKFLTACAAETSQQLNITKLATIAEISVPTANEWLKLLISLNIIYLLRPYYNNLLKRLAKTPKLYFLDSGLCAYLCKWPTPEILLNGASSGAFFETFVVTEILKGYSYSAITPELSYYRDSNGKEIDLLIQIDRSIHPIGIKLSARPDKREVYKFDFIEKASLQKGNGGIICMCKKRHPRKPRGFLNPGRNIIGYK